MDFNDLAGKAKDLAEEHPEQLAGAVDKVGEAVKEKYGHDEQVDEGIAKIKGAIPGGEA